MMYLGFFKERISNQRLLLLMTFKKEEGKTINKFMLAFVSIVFYTSFNPLF